MDDTKHIEASRTRDGDPAAQAAPWVVSAVLHIGLVIIGLLVTWTVILVQDMGPPPRVTAERPPGKRRPREARPPSKLMRCRGGTPRM